MGGEKIYIALYICNTYLFRTRSLFVLRSLFLCMIVFFSAALFFYWEEREGENQDPGGGGRRRGGGDALMVSTYLQT